MSNFGKFTPFSTEYQCNQGKLGLIFKGRSLTQLNGFIGCYYIKFENRFFLDKDTVAAFQVYAKNNNKAELDKLKLKLWIPFWADLLHMDFPLCITPDILHQCHKGVFKSYMIK